MVKRFYNGIVYTMDDSCPLAQSFVVGKGKIIFVGTDSLSKSRFPHAIDVDLQGRCVLPGFIDSHIHLMLYGESLKSFSITGRTKEEILAQVAAAAEAAPEGAWIIGSGGWNNDGWEDTALPTKDELDAVSFNHPVILPKYDGHMIWVNSCALRLAKIHEASCDLVGGEIIRDQNGNVMGCLSGRAKALVQNVIPEKSIEDIRNVLLAAQRELLRMGITSVQDATTPPDMLEALKSLFEQDQFKIRVSTALPIENEADLLDNQALLDYCKESSTFGDKMFCNALKVFVDGSMSSYTAALQEEYSDRPGHWGKLCFSDEALAKIFTFVAAQGKQLLGHCIGDAASEQYIRTAEQVSPHAVEKNRFRMEHFHLAPDDLLERAVRSHLLISVQPTHGPMNPTIAVKRLGDRIHKTYSYKRMLNACHMLPMGSDAPVTSPNPFWGIYTAVARKNPEDTSGKSFYPEEAVTREEAVKGYSIWGAYAMLCEQKLGSITPNKYADFIITSKDIMSCPVDDLPKTDVISTYIGGELVYKKE